MSDKRITLEKDKNENEFFFIEFDYDAKLVEFVKKIPTRKFDSFSKRWKIHADHITAKYVDSFARKLNFNVDQSAKDYIDKMIYSKFTVEIPKLKRELREFQKEGVMYAIKYQRCFIADDMGVGKSGESIAAVETTKSYPCLIICPSSLKLNWKKEISLWLDNRSVKVIEGLIKVDYEIVDNKKIVVGYKMPDYDADFVIINYDILYRDKRISKLENPNNIIIPDHKDLLKQIPFKSIIIDESHLCSNHKSLRTKAVKEIAKKIKYRFALSGTPILNKPRELIAQLDILDRLDSLGGFWEFATRYCNAKEGNFGWDLNGSSNLDELHERLKTTCFIRRKKEDVLSELPEKQRIMLPVEISNRDEYEKVSKNFVKWMKNNLMSNEEYYEELKKIDYLTESQRKQILENKVKYKLNKILLAETAVKIEKLKQIAAKGKLNKIFDFIDNFLSYDEKLIIFAKHKEIYNKIIERYKDISVHVVGGMSTQQKNNSVEKFKTDENTKLFIGAINAAGVGLNLTESNTVIFVEFDWTPAIHEQAEDRAHRIGQKDFVKCYYFYGENTIDEYILEIIEEKRKITLNVSDGKNLELENDISKIISKFI